LRGASTCLKCLSAKATAEKNCVGCSVGRFGDSSTNTCEDCPNGKYAEGGDGPSCSFCPAGYHANAQTRISRCFECIAGTWSSERGAVSDATCSKCRAGTYSDKIGAMVEDSCIRCATGTFSNVEGADHESKCMYLRMYLNVG
jgi:hypothetical protein